MKHREFIALAALAIVVGLSLAPQIVLGQNTAKVEETAKKELADFQGTWNFVYYEEKGVVQEPGTRQFVIAENGLDFRQGGETRSEATIEVDPTQNPKQFTQKFKDDQIYRSIYVLAGDFVILCGRRNGDTSPSEFSCGTDKKGGEFLILLKRQS